MKSFDIIIRGMIQNVIKIIQSRLITNNVIRNDHVVGNSRSNIPSIGFKMEENDAIDNRNMLDSSKSSHM